MLPASLTEGTPLRQTVDEPTWTAVMSSIAKRHDLPATNISPCSRGSDVVYALGATAVVKLTAPKWGEELATEATFLTGLEDKLSVHVPRVLGSGDVDGWPYVITSFVPGEHLDDVWPDLSPGQRLDIARQLGGVMAELHQQSIPGLPAPDWPDFVAEQTRAAIDYHGQRGAREHWLDACEALLAELPELYPSDAVLVPLHTELLGTHVFVSSTDDAWQVSALIDFADGMIGHPDYEIAGLVEFIFRNEPALLPACLAAYGWTPDRLTEQHGRRLLACALLHRFASLPRMLEAAGMNADDPADIDELRRRLYRLEG